MRYTSAQRLKDGHEEVTIFYRAIRHNHDPNRFLPQIEINGRTYGSTYCEQVLTESEALALARLDAIEEVNRHGGDWHITVNDEYIPDLDRVEIAQCTT